MIDKERISFRNVPNKSYMFKQEKRHLESVVLENKEYDPEDPDFCEKKYVEKNFYWYELRVNYFLKQAIIFKISTCDLEDEENFMTDEFFKENNPGQVVNALVRMPWNAFVDNLNNEEFITLYVSQCTGTTSDMEIYPGEFFDDIDDFLEFRRKIKYKDFYKVRECINKKPLKWEEIQNKYSNKTL